MAKIVNDDDVDKVIDAFVQDVCSVIEDDEVRALVSEQVRASIEREDVRMALQKAVDKGATIDELIEKAKGLSKEAVVDDLER